MWLIWSFDRKTLSIISSFIQLQKVKWWTHHERQSQKIKKRVDTRSFILQPMNHMTTLKTGRVQEEFSSNISTCKHTCTLWVMHVSLFKVIISVLTFLENCDALTVIPNRKYLLWTVLSVQLKNTLYMVIFILTAFVEVTWIF